MHLSNMHHGQSAARWKDNEPKTFSQILLTVLNIWLIHRTWKWKSLKKVCEESKHKDVIKLVRNFYFSESDDLKKLLILAQILNLKMVHEDVILCVGWARKFPLSKIHSTRSTSWILAIQILIKSWRIIVFL